ncbi:MAG: D-alanine--D-alanine ligase [Clostridia bacterium]|nr:D-alanine--D-alanine ligase [Clostridia bacterium]
MKIVVLCGGLSPEREVSLASGKMVAEALAHRGHEVALVDLSDDVPVGIPFGAEFVPKPRHELSGREIGDGIIELCRRSDAVFPALHGGVGEDGRLRAALDLFGIRCAGAEFLSCAIAMDKQLSKTLMRVAGVTVPRGTALSKGDPIKRSDVKFPCVIKPNCGGSSVGVAFADNESELAIALETAFDVTDKVVIEEKLIGRELTVGIVNGRALPAVEIKPKVGFYDYKNKYTPGATEEICPAPLTDAEASRLCRSAIAAASAVGTTALCRVDFILSGGIFYCLEINALPGMTETSLLPLAAKTAGMDFPQLCEEILKTAF